MKTINIGDSAEIVIKATDETVRQIATVSGDVNPVHLDDEYAKESIFGKRIAHGLFCLNGISRVLGTVLPGEGAILLSQSFKYKSPVYINDEITVRVVTKEIKVEKNIYVFDIICTNQDRVIVLEGESALKWNNQ